MPSGSFTIAWRSRFAEPAIAAVRAGGGAALEPFTSAASDDHEAIDDAVAPLGTQLGLGEVADLIASALPVEAELRQCLLAELDPVARTTLLTDQIHTLAAVMRIRRTQSPAADWKLN